MTDNRLLAGALLIVAAELMFAFRGASIRQVSSELNNGMACAPAARPGPFTFFSVVFGALLGWATVVGTLLVLASAILVGRGLRQRMPAPVAARA